jgi:hypothetical protein
LVPLMPCGRSHMIHSLTGQLGKQRC